MSMPNSFSEKNTNATSCISTIPNNHLKPFLLQKTVEESIIMSLLSLADSITKKGDEYCQHCGITALQYITMLHMAGDPNIEYIEENKTNNPIVASELAEALNVSRPNITNLLNLLIEKNLVRQVKKTGDWRRKYLVLTEEGWNLLEKVQPIRLRINRRLLSHLSDKDKECLLESLRTCRDLLNQ